MAGGPTPFAALQEENRRLREQLEALRSAARAAMNEIGVPGDGYPASIANAYWLLCDVIGESNPASTPKEDA